MHNELFEHSKLEQNHPKKNQYDLWIPHHRLRHSDYPVERPSVLTLTKTISGERLFKIRILGALYKEKGNPEAIKITQRKRLCLFILTHIFSLYPYPLMPYFCQWYSNIQVLKHWIPQNSSHIHEPQFHQKLYWQQ